MSRLSEFYAAHPQHRPGDPVSELAAGADMWARRLGSPPVPQTALSRVVVDAARGQAIGQAYDRLPSFDPEAVPSFRAMANETGRQFDFLTAARGRGGLGIDVEVTPEDPYDGPESLRNDLREGRMKVLGTAGTGGHPFFTDDQNDQFRAVHDAFGHAATGRGFDRHGEEAAWVSHSRMYTPAARAALTTETRGQNSSFIFSGGGRNFAEQKVATLPPGMQSPLSALVESRRGRLLALNQFRTL